MGIRYQPGNLDFFGLVGDHGPAASVELIDSAVEYLSSLFTTLDQKTYFHSLRLASHALRLAERFDFDNEETLELATGALLHDIGKIALPSAILLKPGHLDCEQKKAVMDHPIIGYRMLLGRFSDRVAEMVLYHHERFDGCGYPAGLRGEQIPLEARILAILDAYDAMTSDRSYGRRLTVGEAHEEILLNTGTQFDPWVVERFLKVSCSEWDCGLPAARVESDDGLDRLANSIIAESVAQLQGV